MTSPNPENATHDTRPPRFTEVGRALRYPPIFLMALTVIALLLAMGTAHADEPAATFERAAEQLSKGQFEDFASLFPETAPLVVSESWGLAGEAPEVFRQSFEQPLDEAAWSADIRPLTELIGLESDAVLTCESEGICVLDGDGYRVRLVFGAESGATKLLALEVWHEVLGC